MVQDVPKVVQVSDLVWSWGCLGVILVFLATILGTSWDLGSRGHPMKMCYLHKEPKVVPGTLFNRFSI